jgi:hypothetical protein
MQKTVKSIKLKKLESDVDEFERMDSEPDENSKN